MLFEQKSCTVNSVKELMHGIDIYCAQKNCTKGQLVNSIFIALLTGDMVVEKDLDRKLKKHGGITEDVNSMYKVAIYDREGRLLNPTDIEIDYE